MKRSVIKTQLGMRLCEGNGEDLEATAIGKDSLGED
jgi:hypothetical protein